jgi:hypothetical protein
VLMPLPVISRDGQRTIQDYYLRPPTPTLGTSILADTAVAPLTPIQAKLHQPVTPLSRRRRIVDSDDELAVAPTRAILPLIGSSAALPCRSAAPVDGTAILADPAVAQPSPVQDPLQQPVLPQSKRKRVTDSDGEVEPKPCVRARMQLSCHIVISRVDGQKSDDDDLDASGQYEGEAEESSDDFIDDEAPGSDDSDDGAAQEVRLACASLRNRRTWRAAKRSSCLLCADMRTVLCHLLGLDSGA